jgi:hypothetical protein
MHGLMRCFGDYPPIEVGAAKVAIEEHSGILSDIGWYATGDLVVEIVDPMGPQLPRKDALRGAAERFTGLLMDVGHYHNNQDKLVIQIGGAQNTDRLHAFLESALKAKEWVTVRMLGEATRVDIGGKIIMDGSYRTAKPALG